MADPGRELGLRLRAARRGAGISLRSLARSIGVSPATMSQLETGRVSLSVERLWQISEVLAVPASALLDGSEVAAPRRAEPRPVTERPAAWRCYPPLDLDPVLRAALAEFLEIGYHGASVRGIAQRCGLSVSGLYHHYSSKQAMLRRILDLAMTELLGNSRAAVAAGRDPVERFSYLVETLVLFHTHRSDLGFVGAAEMRSFDPANRAEIAALRNTQQRLVDAEVRDAVRQGLFGTSHPRQAARAVVTMCTALSQWYRADGSLSPEQLAGTYVEFALDLMRHDRADSSVENGLRGDGGTASSPSDRFRE